MMGMAGMGLWMLVWALFALAVLVLAGFGVVYLARGPGRIGREHQPPTETLREILRRRYAAGEIDEDEYVRRLSGLTQQ